MHLTRAGGNPDGYSFASWWLRSPYVDRSEFFGCVGDYGDPDKYYDFMSRCVVPAFSM